MNGISEKLFQAVFENSPVGLVLIDKDTALLKVNNYMLEAFKIKPDHIKGRMFGNVFNCTVVSGHDAVCGTMEDCKKCPIRAGITEVLKTGVPISNAIIDHDFVIDRITQRKWFKISASKIETGEEELSIISFSDITSQKEFEELLNSQLSLDMATGVTNKYALLNALKNLAYGREDMTIALIDFDDFKQVNDVYGHVVGDRVLKLFCDAAITNTRKQDILGRFGGEEFIIIFPGMSSGLLIKALGRIASYFKELCEKELGLTTHFSAGIAEVSSEQLAQMSVEAIIDKADINLYLSKNRGKNCVTFNGESVPFE